MKNHKINQSSLTLNWRLSAEGGIELWLDVDEEKLTPGYQLELKIENAVAQCGERCVPAGRGWHLCPT
jgi:hypothetical protein